MKAWNIKQLQQKLSEDMAQCNNAFERSMVLAIAGRDIREKAEEFSSSRKLTPGEIAIAEQYGYKG